ncbi:MAG: head-tail connector protein [Pseudomonadota bacterium]
MGLMLLTPPTSDPLTLAEAKAQCRVLHDDEDALIARLVTAATRHVERALSLSLIERTYVLTLDSFSDAIELPRGPVASVTSLTYSDADGVTQTVSAADYTVDLVSRPQWLVRNSSASWPATLDGVNVVSVQYVAGFDELPAEYEDLKHAIALLVGHFYANREAVTADRQATEVPMAVEALMQPFRMVLV